MLLPHVEGGFMVFGNILTDRSSTGRYAACTCVHACPPCRLAWMVFPGHFSCQLGTGGAAVAAARHRNAYVQALSHMHTFGVSALVWAAVGSAISHRSTSCAGERKPRKKILGMSFVWEPVSHVAYTHGVTLDFSGSWQQFVCRHVGYALCHRFCSVWVCQDV